ncbi:MAG: iron hydrogenase small subunit [Coriobacteriaceae bacterium]
MPLATPRCASLWPAAWRIRRSCWTRWNPGAAFDFVEIMACPGGCVGGGGQPIQFNSELAQARAGVLNRLDAADKLRYSHENPDIAKLYADWIGEPLSHTAHEWLHTDQESWQI